MPARYTGVRPIPVKTRRKVLMKVRLGLCAVIVAVAAIVGIHGVKASPQQPLGTPCVINVPSDWGGFKGISKYGLVFEDKNGTLRLIDQTPCEIGGGNYGVPNVSVEIRRK